MLKKSPDQIFEAFAYQDPHRMEGQKPQSAGQPSVFGVGFVLPSGMENSVLFSDISRYNAVPIILGTNHDKVNLFYLTNGSYINKLFRLLPIGFKDQDGYKKMIRYGSDLWKLRGVDSLARLMRESRGENVFTYL